SWRKAFKAQWRCCQNTPISLPLNPKYRPDPYRWVCTCPYFFKSRFLLCKHLVQAVHPVDPVFFREVERSRTVPFWSHPTLIPLLPPTGVANATQTVVQTSNAANPSVALGAAGDADAEGDEGPGFGSDDDEDITDARAATGGGLETFDERLDGYLERMRDFCDGLEYQRQFRDSRFLDTLEREGAKFFRLVDNCRSRERRANSTRAAAPTTWEQSTANAMLLPYSATSIRA
ncbi:hypothetical protein B0H11DRAFT_1756772, partial [Mycena galericulata]